METKQKVNNILHNLNNAYAVQEVSYDANNSQFKFFYNDEVHNPIGGGRFEAYPNAWCFVSLNNIQKDFYEAQHTPGHYIDHLFKTSVDYSVIPN